MLIYLKLGAINIFHLWRIILVLILIGNCCSFCKNVPANLSSKIEKKKTKIIFLTNLTPAMYPYSFVCVCVVSCFSHVQLYDAMDCSLPGSSVHGIFQARILDWVAISFSRVSFKPRNETLNSCVYWIGRQIICHWTTWEARGQNIKYDKITILNDVTEKKTHLVTFIKVEYFCPHWRTKYFLVHKIFCLCTKGWLWYPSLQPIQVESLE